MIVTPDTFTTHGEGLDHPESVCISPEGVLFAGGEAGQIYRIDSQGQRMIASTGGFILGLTMDGDGVMYACDCGRQAIYRVRTGPDAERWCDRAGDRPLAVPNHSVFTADGRLLFSDSGDYWSPQGTGFIGVVEPDGSSHVFHAGPFRFANGVAIDPSQTWLYVAQSTGANVVRIRLDRPGSDIEVTHRLPERTVPDGLCFAADGRLIIACYKPDGVFVGHPDGSVEQLLDDPTGEILSRPTNAALHGHRLYIANLGGHSIVSIPTDMRPAPIHRPHLAQVTSSK